MLFSLVSAHTVLGIENGEFLSLLEPPAEFEAMAAECKNVGTWPVLVGEQNMRQAILSSPIILYDYPQIAPESPGSLFDGTEIDEILSLRIMTLTDQEKHEIRQSDDRAREILDRTEQLPGRAVHETPRHSPESATCQRGVAMREWEWQLLEDKAMLDHIEISGEAVREGDRVRLCPHNGGDILDIALRGQVATIEAIEEDYEGKRHVCVVLDEDPGRDLGLMRQPGHRFFFDPADELPFPAGLEPEQTRSDQSPCIDCRHRKHLSRRRRIRSGSGTASGRL